MAPRSPSRDLTFLLALLFASYSLHFFPSTLPLVSLLELDAKLLQSGQVYRLLTFPFVGAVTSPLLYVVASAAIYALGMKVAPLFARRRLWWTLVAVGAAAGTVAVLASMALVSLDLAEWESLEIVQGQHLILSAWFGGWVAGQRGRAVRIAGFSLRSATVVMVFLGILALVSVAGRDVAGGAGLAAAAALFYAMLVPGGLRHPVQHLRALFWRRRFEKMARDHGLYVVPDRDDTIN